MLLRITQVLLDIATDNVLLHGLLFRQNNGLLFLGVTRMYWNHVYEGLYIYDLNMTRRSFRVSVAFLDLS